jgi:hypothetical protein
MLFRNKLWLSMSRNRLIAGLGAATTSGTPGVIVVDLFEMTDQQGEGGLAPKLAGAEKWSWSTTEAHP